MLLEYFPRRMLRAKLRDGWEFLKGMTYEEDEWAFVLILRPGDHKPTPRELNAMMLPFDRYDRRMKKRLSSKTGRSNNKSAASTSRNLVRYGHVRDQDAAGQGAAL